MSINEPTSFSLYLIRFLSNKQKADFFEYTIWSVTSCNPYQGTTTEEDHEDDQGLKPVVFHNHVARFP